jgi:predicted nuclease of predicted toxin-antitoxin system
VNFLVDNQLPAALVRLLVSRGHQAQHVLDVGLDEASDSAIWRFAATNGLVLITKDEDFLAHASTPGAAVLIVWVRLGNCRNASLLASFDSILPQLEAALRAGNRVIEVR